MSFVTAPFVVTDSASTGSFRALDARKPGATFIGEVKCSQSMYDDLKARSSI